MANYIITNAFLQLDSLCKSRSIFVQNEYDFLKFPRACADIKTVTYCWIFLGVFHAD
jgi:hypothetical protein